MQMQGRTLATAGAPSPCIVWLPMALLDLRRCTIDQTCQTSGPSSLNRKAFEDMEDGNKRVDGHVPVSPTSFISWKDW